jgi:hypothetical protein
MRRQTTLRPCTISLLQALPNVFRTSGLTPFCDLYRSWPWAIERLHQSTYTLCNGACWVLTAIFWRHVHAEPRSLQFPHSGLRIWLWEPVRTLAVSFALSKRPGVTKIVIQHQVVSNGYYCIIYEYVIYRNTLWARNQTDQLTR